MQKELHKLGSRKSYDSGQFSFIVILLKRNTRLESQPFPKRVTEEFLKKKNCLNSEPLFVGLQKPGGYGRESYSGSREKKKRIYGKNDRKHTSIMINSRSRIKKQ